MLDDGPLIVLKAGESDDNLAQYCSEHTLRWSVESSSDGYWINLNVQKKCGLHSQRACVNRALVFGILLSSRGRELSPNSHSLILHTV